MCAYVYTYKYTYIYIYIFTLYSYLYLLLNILKRKSIFRPNFKIIDGELKTDCFVKATRTHQYLDPNGITFSQVLRFNRICSDNEKFDKPCNNLEKWLKEIVYNEEMIQKQISRAYSHSRNNLPESEKHHFLRKK